MSASQGCPYSVERGSTVVTIRHLGMLEVHLYGSRLLSAAFPKDRYVT